MGPMMNNPGTGLATGAAAGEVEGFYRGSREIKVEF
jgi:hypothetical protein